MLAGKAIREERATRRIPFLISRCSTLGRRCALMLSSASVPNCLDSDANKVQIETEI
jgi:hypothetical protein